MFFLNVRICCFLLSFVMVNEDYFSFGLLVGHKKIFNNVIGLWMIVMSIFPYFKD